MSGNNEDLAKARIKPKYSSNERVIRYEGGSLVLSVPKWIAKKIDWTPGDKVKFTELDNDKLIIQRVVK